MVVLCATALAAVSADEIAMDTSDLYYDPDMSYTLYDHVQVLSRDEAATLRECHDSGNACRLSRRAIEARSLEEGSVLIHWGDESSESLAIRVKDIEHHDNGMSSVHHHKPDMSHVFATLNIDVSTESHTPDGRARRALHDGRGVSQRRDLVKDGLAAAAVMKHRFMGTQEYAITEWLKVWKSGPDVNFKLNKFKIDVGWTGLKEFHVEVKASASASMGIKGTTWNPFTYSKKLLNTGDMPFAVIPLPLPLPITLNFNFRNFLKVYAGLDAAWTGKIGYQAGLSCVFGIQKLDDEWDSYFRPGFEAEDENSPAQYLQHSPIIEFKAPTFGFVAGAENHAEVSMMISLGPLGLVGPYFRVIPGVEFTWAPQTPDNYGIALKLKGKIGIKGPTWESTWFSFSVEWGKEFDIITPIQINGKFSDGFAIAPPASPGFSSKPQEIPVASPEISEGDVDTLKGKINDGVIRADTDGGPATRFVVTIKTGDVKHAGTDAGVYVAFIDEAGQGRQKHIWIDDADNNFERNRVDTFIIDAPEVKDVTGLVIGHDHAYAGSSWYLDSVLLEFNGIKREFDAKLWISENDDYDIDPDVKWLRSVTLHPKRTSATYTISVRMADQSYSGTSEECYIIIMGKEGDVKFDIGHSFSRNRVTEVRRTGKYVGDILSVKLGYVPGSWSWLSNDDYKASMIKVTSTDSKPFYWYLPTTANSGDYWVEDGSNPRQYS